MFEPENQIERDLMRASVDVGARSAFARTLLDAEVFVILMPEAGSIRREPGEKATVLVDTIMTLATAMPGGEVVVPFFTAPLRARTWFEGDHVIVPDKARDLFARHSGTSFILNPGSGYGKEYLSGEVEDMLAGRINGEVTVPAGSTVLLGYPEERPDELIAALSKELDALKSVRGAWLLLASIEGQPESTWMLGIDHQGSDWSRVCEAVSSAASSAPKGHPVDVTPLEKSAFANTLRTGIPIIAAKKRGLFNWFR